MLLSRIQHPQLQCMHQVLSLYCSYVHTQISSHNYEEKNPHIWTNLTGFSSPDDRMLKTLMLVLVLYLQACQSCAGLGADECDSQGQGLRMHIYHTHNYVQICLNTQTRFLPDFSVWWAQLASKQEWSVKPRNSLIKDEHLFSRSIHASHSHQFNRCASLWWIQLGACNAKTRLGGWARDVTTP